MKSLVELNLSESKLIVLLNLYIYNKNSMERLKEIAQI